MARSEERVARQGSGQDEGSGLRLAELIAALSLATDLGTGQPLERALRTALLAVHLGGEAGLGDAELRDVYYTALLRFVGCMADSHHLMMLFGDELEAGAGIPAVELWKPLDMMQFMAQQVGRGRPPLERARMIAGSLTRGIAMSEQGTVSHCEVAQRLCERLGMGGGVSGAIAHIFERWDGHGHPYGVKQEELALPMRVVHLAEDAEFFARYAGPEAAVAVIRRRAGGLHDPALAERFCRHATRLFALLDVSSAWEALLAAEPGEHTTISTGRLDTATRAIADFADLRSSFSAGHSSAVAELAAAAAGQCGLDEAATTATRRAALLHDVGRTGVSLAILEKEGPLGESEWERLRLYPYYTERVLARPRVLAQLGSLAALHRERLDGSGYHRGLPAALLPPGARILAAADAYRSMTERRPYRPAISPEVAASELQREARAGLLDGEAVRAVLAAAGQSRGPARRSWPAGLSEREVEVLRLIARGHTNREMARLLSISPSTVDHHIRHIYNKIDVSTRPAATLFAMQHDLLT